jgi:hypothetical protein
MGVSWNDDRGPSGLPGNRRAPSGLVGPPPRLAGSRPQHPHPHPHRRRRRPALIARPHAAAVTLAALLTPHRLTAPRRAYRRYWV